MNEAKDMEGWIKIWPKDTNDNDMRWYKEGKDFEPNGKQLRALREFGIDHQIGIMREAILPSRKDKY